MSEGAILAGIARGRAGITDPMPVDAATVRGILATVPDPELPVVSIADLGIIHEVSVTSDSIDVTILPTFIGCPALELIHATVTEALAPLGRPVRVRTSFAVPWSSDRLTEAGRSALRSAGIAPPVEPSDLTCPHCGSGDVTMDNLFGPTQCRSVHYCRGCRQPFEAFKPL